MDDSHTLPQLIKPDLPDEELPLNELEASLRSQISQLIREDGQDPEKCPEGIQKMARYYYRNRKGHGDRVWLDWTASQVLAYARESGLLKAQFRNQMRELIRKEKVEW